MSRHGSPARLARAPRLPDEVDSAADHMTDVMVRRSRRFQRMKARMRSEARRLMRYGRLEF